MYQRKYFWLSVAFWSGSQGGGLTCEVQTLLKVTKANVWAIMEVARSFLARTKGMRTQERSSCGKKARDSARMVEEEGTAELRYRRVL